MVDTSNREENKDTGSQSTSQAGGGSDDSSSGTSDIKDKGSMSEYSTKKTGTSY